MAQWIAGITRGHNAGVCLLRDGEIVFAIEEERLSRFKYDGGPYASMIKILEFTDKLDYLVIAHTVSLIDDRISVDFTGDDVYTGIARKLGLIERKSNLLEFPVLTNHPQVIDLSHIHHKLHAACAFYRSGFDRATSVIVDGAGSHISLQVNNNHVKTWELESIFTCEYPFNIKTIYKHQGGNGPFAGKKFANFPSLEFGEKGTHELIIDDTAGIGKAFEAVTRYCGFSDMEPGKTMGLFPYGKPNNRIPSIFTDYDGRGCWKSTDRNLIIPAFPYSAIVNQDRYDELTTSDSVIENNEDVTCLENRRDMAYAIQTQSQTEVLSIIKKAVNMSGINNVVLSGGYALNCVANYSYLDYLKREGINFYVEPISSDFGTCIGAALLVHYSVTANNNVRPYADSLFLGPPYKYTEDEIWKIATKYKARIVKEVTDIDVVKLLRNKNIVALFQGRSENGPRALGNRSILFDPSFDDGKDFVNRVKRREYFRPFAGSILYEHAHEWFDLKGMDQSPHMMYAVNCKKEKTNKIPSIIHVDGTCRIQTVKKEQNPLFYNLINEFYKISEIPILFNTSFNLGGEPMVETLDDAIRTLANSLIEYLYLPEHKLIIEIRNEIGS